MYKEIDARGEACPKPVIMTKKELDNIEKGVVVTIVDNEVAKENVSKLANSLGLKFSLEQPHIDEYRIIINKNESEINTSRTKLEKLSGSTLAIGSDKMGSGSDELGQILMKSFIYTIRETKPYPSAIILYNSGVRLSCKNSPVLDDLKVLFDEGVEIISCGTCLDYFNIKDDLSIGIISNMYSIYEKMKDSNVINIG